MFQFFWGCDAGCVVVPAAMKDCRVWKMLWTCCQKHRITSQKTQIIVTLLWEPHILYSI